MLQKSPCYYYDKIYSFKDYQSEVKKLLSFIPQELKTGQSRLLDVACGTGGHLQYLKQVFDVQGLDISGEYLEIANEKFPEVHFHQADMINFQLNQEFEIITCLFSSISYVLTLENLEKTIRCFQRHLVKGGILLIEPWFTPAEWKPNKAYAVFSDEPELKIARVSTSKVAGKISWFDFHFLIGTPDGTTHFVEHHELGLFESDEIRTILKNNGFRNKYEKDGITGRGLYVGRKMV
jgi:SAM-dependent methyltransferase